MTVSIANILSYAKSILTKRLDQKSQSAGLFCLNITPHTINFVILREEFNRKTVELCRSTTYQGDKLAVVLKQLVEKYNVKTLACLLLLNPEDYQLILTDALPVKKEEFQAAIRWKIKDILHIPLSDVIIDYYDMPPAKNTLEKKIMVVAASQSKLKTLLNIIEQLGINVKYIDIPEMAIRNIALLFKEKDQSIAVIHLSENNINLYIILENSICITRKLKFNLEASDYFSAKNLEKLSYEVNRSFEYFQTYYGHPFPSKSLLISEKKPDESVLDQLASKIKTAVILFDICSQIHCKDTIDLYTQAKFVFLLGSLLKKESMVKEHA